MPYVQLDVTDRFIARWKRRFVDGGVLALADAQRAGRQDHRLTPAMEARILRITQEERPPVPLTHWTSRRLGNRVGVSNTTVLHVWRRAGLKPHLLDRYLASNDPEFETKAADVIGLYFPVSLIPISYLLHQTFLIPIYFSSTRE